MSRKETEEEEIEYEILMDGVIVTKNYENARMSWQHH
jgi:uncharacterized membrane protein YcaP (DUF421 family)